jgi:cytochrome c5/uncharacterized protein YneF (UPF0154 family)
MGEMSEHGSLKTKAMRIWLWLKSLLASAWARIWTKLKLLWPQGVAAGRAVGAWRLRHILLSIAVILLVIYLGILASVFVAVKYLAFQIPHNPPVNDIVYLDQGWGPSVTSEMRQFYYYAPQGTSFVNLRYSWFINMEQADSSDRFADPSHMRSLGFIVDNLETPSNPYRLPVGFTKHFDPNLKEEFLDVTCAACHTGELHAVRKTGEQVAIRIDGGQGMHAFTSARPGQFGPAIMAAMTATLLNPWKFNRFARSVLAGHYDEGKWHLRAEFFTMLMNTLAAAFSDTVHQKYPVDEGFGRTDAIARISNRVFGDEIDAANYVKGSGPVSYPSIWDAPRYDWVQYTGSVSQPLARNLGESLGVGATAEFVDAYGRPVPPDRRFSSESNIDNLVKIEETIEALRPPRWPDQILGAVDPQKVKTGRQLYEKHCQHCHEPCLQNPFQTAVAMPQRPSDNPLWHVNLIPIEEVGTDPQTALNFFNDRINLEKTGVTAAEVSEMLSAELREEAFRKQSFQNLKDAFDRWKAANPSPTPAAEQEFLKGADAMRRDDHKQMETLRLELRKKGAQPSLPPEVEAAIGQQLDVINIRSTTIGQGLNYLGLFLRNRYFLNDSTPLISRAPAEMGAALRSWYRTSTDNDDVELYKQELQESINGWGALDLPQVLKVYKAKPLGGIWATAPYLHNGSVPTLYDMLLPAERRPKMFFISRMNFDPVSVGLVKEPLADKGFWFDTSIPGNLNIGHEFRAGYGGYDKGASPTPGVIGPELTDDERWALVEYLKVHVDQPAICKVYESPAGGRK